MVVAATKWFTNDTKVENVRNIAVVAVDVVVTAWL